jgi:hypothetical protein
MYVRWKRRTLGPSQRHAARDTVIVEDAVLVESVRLGAMPTQIHHAHLGSITVEPTVLGVLERGRFWKRADARLDALELSQADRLRIEAALEAKIPRSAPEPAPQGTPLVTFEPRSPALAARIALGLSAPASAYVQGRGAAVINVLDALTTADRSEEATVVRTLLNYRGITSAFRHCVEQGYIAFTLAPKRGPRLSDLLTAAREGGSL